MALQNAYINPAGVTVDYWRIGSFQFSQSHGFVDIQILGYISSETRTNGKDYVEARKARVVFDKFDQYFSPAQMDVAGQNVIAIAYRYLKEQDPFFFGAIDV